MVKFVILSGDAFIFSSFGNIGIAPFLFYFLKLDTLQLSYSWCFDFSQVGHMTKIKTIRPSALDFDFFLTVH